MENCELKTPLRPPKRYRNPKKRTEETKVEEFLSMSSSAYFQYDDEELDQLESSKRESIRTEKSIDEWLTARQIYLTPVSKKKEDYFEEKRERINSISFFDKETEEMLSTEDTFQPNRSRAFTSQIFSLTPGNSKISKKRNDFSDLSDLKMSALRNSSPIPGCFEMETKKSRFQQMGLTATHSVNAGQRRSAAEDGQDRLFDH